LLQELYEEADKNIVEIQNEINKLTNSVQLNEEIMDAKAKYAKAIKKEGYETGLCEGRSEERKENVKSAFKMVVSCGLDLESAIIKISENFNLTIEEIKKILEE
jgi:flagellar biosynthesis/type III secretory pathway protein FliH